MNKYLGKKFVFATIAIVCVSVVTILLHYSGEIYFKIVLTICGIFTAAQTVADIKNKEGKNEHSPNNQR